MEFGKVKAAIKEIAALNARKTGVAEREREKMKTNLYFVPYGKLTWVIELNVKPKPIKLLE